MTTQRLLLKLSSFALLRGPCHRILRNRVWTVEGGKGAGLRLQFPQNRDFITGKSEPPVQQEIARRLGSAGVFYDVGANIGFFSMIAGRLVGEKGCVCAFEPHPRNAASVRENANLNGLANIRLFEVAAGRNSRRDELLMTEWDGGATLLKSLAGPFHAVARTEVQVVALDEFIAAHKLPQPTFVKIDVEGTEHEVLEGMTATLARCKPILLYEIDDENQERFKQRWAGLDESVRELGYKVVHLDNSYPAMNWNVGHSLALPLNGG